MSEIKKTYDKLIARIREISLLQSCQSVLWRDERVNMPPKGGKHRGDQLSLLAGMVIENFNQFFGITPPDDADGCMQDIHWSAGYIGYFPSYTMGILYAAQFFAQAREDISGLEDMFAEGKFAPLKIWLNENIHRQGKRYRSNRLIERVTGKPFSYQPLMGCLKSKFNPLYNL